MLDEFSATIEKIYAAASSGLRWQEALLSIEELTGSTGAVIDVVPILPTISRTTLAGSFSEENCLEYARDYQAICPRIRYAVQHPSPETQYDYLFLTEFEMDRDPVYEWFGRHGLRYYLGAEVARTPNYLAMLSLQRTKRQGHAEADDVQLFDLIKPHVANAITLADQLGTLRSFERFSSAVLEALPQAVFALDSAGLVRFANARARQMLAAADGIGMEAGSLTTAIAADQSRLDALIAGAASATPAGSGGWSRVARPSGRLPYVLFVSPLVNDDDELLASSCRVLVLVHDFSEARSVDVHVLTSIFGLTETEARLASAIAFGHSVESAAAVLNMQTATARSHLKSIFAKTGVHRQQDLVRLLTSLSSMKL